MSFLALLALPVVSIVPEFRAETIDEKTVYTGYQDTFGHCLGVEYGATMTPITPVRQGMSGDAYTRCVWVRGVVGNAWADKVYVPYPDSQSMNNVHAAADCPFKPSEYVNSGNTGGWHHRHIVGQAPSGGTLNVKILYAPGGNGSISDGQYQIIYGEKHTYTENGQSQADLKWHKWVEGVHRINCTDASVDSRVAYGAENAPYDPSNSNDELKDYHADPNAIPHNLNFGDWVFKGGLFAGLVQWTDGDFSGRAHMQFWGADKGDAFLASLNLLHMPPPVHISGIDGVVNLGSFTWGADTSTTESTATWANRFLLGVDEPIDDGFTDSVQFEGAGSTEEYAWALNKFDTSDYTTLYTDRIAIAPLNLDSTTLNRWRYFASREFENLGWTSSDFPFNDSRPRIYTLTQVSHDEGP